ncbi:AAA family ATPase [Treponema denticola]|uniref:ATP-binding protein n=1 Tax=Treponema denticola TaxID=158 RepID=UPI0020A32A17|nr:ATP-binding protein [Treponema denticola]UTC93727.1 AAA family ATPase [Treponema denticola]UTC96232.1 AAA family ATPase [Treponema denticola]UTC98704.1 AAA family ATPase [Treponema denticola]
MKENRFTEFKEDLSSGFLKTVSAFANFGTGKILFGIKDDGSIKGIQNPDKMCLDIENKINDSIQPKPDFSFSINRKTGVITLEVKDGAFKPYLYKGKAYRRSDTATVEVDQIELKRLILMGDNMSFEDLPSPTQDLTFESFFRIIQQKLKLESLSTDVLKTLGFYTKKGEFNHAAALFADKNNFSGIDMVRFGASISEILDRDILTNKSILEEYNQAILFFEKYYQYEKIEGMERILIERIPIEAFRETLANAIVHRVWDIPAHIRIAMYPDRLEIYSPGGLPSGISKEEYLKGYISRLRNPIIANVFFRLQLIEMFGTGIKRIIDCYEEYEVKPIFDISENNIGVTLPVVDRKKEVNSDEMIILEILSKGIRLSSSELVLKSGFGKNKVVRLIGSLLEKNYVQKEGSGRGIKYYV